MEVKKGSLILTFLVLTSAFFATLTTIPETVRATTLFVGGAGPGNYTTIQTAINAANPGDTIFVYSGTYDGFTINKTLSIQGEDMNTTIIEGGGSGDVLLVTADWVNITGFVVTKSGLGWFDSGIKILLGENCHVASNKVAGNGNGIILYGSNNTIIVNNTVLSNERVGIRVWGSGNTFANNTVSNNDAGLVLYGNNSSVVSNNFLSSKGNGITVGGSNVTVVANNITGSNYGISLSGSFNTVTNNVMMDDGIYLTGNLPENWNTHIIDTSNEVNSKPVLYWKNATGGTVPSTVGQVILANCTNVIVEDQNVSDTSVGIQLGFSSGNIIANNTAHNSWHGLTFSFSENNTVVNNTVSNGDRGIYLLESDNNTISKSIARNNRHGLYADLSFDNNIIGNNFSSNSEYGMFFGFSDNNRIVNNSASNNRYGIYISASDNNRIVNNGVFSNNQDGILVIVSNNNSISDTDVSLNGQAGVAVLLSTNSTVAGSTITSNGQSGIYLYSSNGNNTIAANDVTNNAIGIFLWYSDNNTIDSNGALSNMVGGIELRDSSNNTIANNTVMSNDYGIYLVSSHNNAIIRNDVMLNAIRGISLRVSGQNIIYHNSIMNNIQQAFDDNSNNQWDDGYPSGGNFWSDYAGFDIYSGPNQDRLGSDGIGDTPHVIDSDSADRYPLTSPFPPLAPMPPFPLSAVLTGTVFENVTITWELSPDDGQRLNSVVRYEIYRNSSYDTGGLGYQFLGSAPNGTSQFIDVQAGEGDSNNYFYRICAVNFNNTARCSGVQLGKFTRFLGPGPIQSDETIQTVLQTLSFDKAWSYDQINQEWRSFMKSKPYGPSLECLNHTMGIWVNVTKDSNLTVAGVVPASTTINLQAGWNLVGFPSFDDNFTVADLKAAIAVERIEGYDALAPPYFLRAMLDGDFLQAGFGYWIKVESDR
jgi:parallel beta-helix repeat protein